MTTSDISYPEAVSRPEWLQARLNLLNQEKELTRARDRLNTARRELPMDAQSARTCRGRI